MKSKTLKRLLISAASFLTVILAVLYFPGKDFSAFKTCRFSSPIVSSDNTILRIIPLEDGLIREKAEYKEIPAEVRNIFIKSEDERFFFHPGVDPVSIARAFTDNLKSGRIVSGASTVNMQLARQLVPHNGGLKGKIREAFSALRYNACFSKEEIFTMWINTIPFGRNTEGIKSASKLFFGCSPEYLSEVQALVLAVVPRSPSFYDPVNNPENLVAAAFDLSLRCSLDISETEIRETAEYSADHIRAYSHPFLAPHFCNRIESIIEDKTAYSGNEILTTLDYELQMELEEVLERRISDAGKFRISSGSGVLIIPDTHEIAAYAGSADYFSVESRGMNDGVKALRQPGSTLKPFLYEFALEKGFTASTILPDIPLEFGSGEVYTPMNFNNRFNGPVRLREALGSSLNIPAVYTLERVGVENFRKRLVSLGFKSLEGQKDSIGLSLALGGAEVSLLELVNCYCVFSDNHNVEDPVFLYEGRGYLKRGKGENNRNNFSDNSAALEAGSGKTDPNIIDHDAALIIRDILTDPLSRTTGFGSSSVFKSEQKVMIKTGTSNQFNNIWAVGLMPDLAGGIWMGNFSGDTVIGAPGSSLPASALLEIFNKSGRGGEFRDQGNLVRKNICTVSGMLAGEHCSSVKSEIFKQGSIPSECTFHTASGTSFPPEYSEWLSLRGIESNLSAADGRELEILSPINNASFILDPYLPEQDQMIRITAVSGNDGPLVILVDGIIIGKGYNSVSAMVKLEKGVHRITADDSLCTKTIEYAVK